jgi:hypothetical protein
MLKKRPHINNHNQTNPKPQPKPKTQPKTQPPREVVHTKLQQQPKKEKTKTFEEHLSTDLFTATFFVLEFACLFNGI